MMIAKGKEKLWQYLYIEKPEIFEVFVNLTDQKKRLEAIISKKIKPGIKGSSFFSILDVGCGDGTLSSTVYYKLLREYKTNGTEFEIYLLDPSDTMLKTAGEKYKNLNQNNVRFILGNIGGEELPCKLIDKKFDLIIISFVFFWIDNWKSAFSQVFSLLKNNGIVLIVSPSEKAKLRKAVIKISTGFEMETVEAIAKNIKEFSNKHYSMKIDTFDSNINIPDEFISKLENESPILEKDKDNLCLLEFLIRNSWLNLDHSQRKGILSKLKQRRSRDDYLCKVLEVSF